MSCCIGCRYYETEGPQKQEDCYTAHCTDPNKPMLGRRRVIDVGWTDYPVDVQSPVWCRGKEEV